jgi:hypothetical protein
MKTKARQTKSKPRTISVKDMHRRYPGEWILIGNPVSDKHLNPIRGEVLFHSKDRDEMYRAALKAKPKHFATLYTGEPDPDMEFVL